MAEIVPGYVPICSIVADRLPWPGPTPPVVPLYACLECGALVAGVAEAGTLAHNNFHRDLRKEPINEKWGAQ